MNHLNPLRDTGWEGGEHRASGLRVRVHRRTRGAVQGRVSVSELASSLAGTAV